MLSIIQRIVKQIIRDKRSLAMILIAPILLLTLIYLLFGNTDYKPKVVLNGIPNNIEKLISKENINVIKSGTMEDLKSKEIDAIITFDKTGINIKMLESDSVKTPIITNAIKKVMGQLNNASNMQIEYIYKLDNNSTFNNLGYMFLGILSFFFVFLLAGIAFVRERTVGTLERLMLTPVSTISVVSGYIIGFGIFAAIQSILMIIFSKYVLGLQFTGSWMLAIILMLLISFVAVSLGILVSSVSKNEFQVMQFIPLAIVPQIFFSGLIPVDTLPYHLDYLSKIMPLYYGCSGLKKVLIHGANFIDIIPYISMLLLFVIIFYAANILVIKKYRAI